MAKKFKKHRYFVLRLIFRLIKLFDTRITLDVDPGGMGTILVVSTTAIGDTLLSTPAIRAIKKRYPKARIAALVHEKRKEMLINNPYIDEIIPYGGKWKGTVELITTLRERDFDAAVILHANDPDIVPIVYLANIPVRIGWRESRFHFLLSHTSPRSAEPEHLIRRRLRIAAIIGAAPDGETMDLVPTKHEIGLAERFIVERGLAVKKLVGIHPFGSHGSKQWSNLPGFLAAAPSRFPEHVFLVLGGEKEIEAAIEMEKKVGGTPENVIFVAGDFSLRQSAALMTRCDCFVTTDSGPMQMALALGVPVVVLAGPTDMRLTGPIDMEKNRIIQKEVSCRPCAMKECDDGTCMASIGADDVFTVLEEMLSAPQPKGE
ncbi:MAG TPA: glycosyltransferase family 9 protein [bacterium]|nr:glycosyltransferase family 9 protein [bacterium]